MFSKQLRFSISLMLITITSNCYLINAQVIQSDSYPGWRLHNLDTYPPKVEDDSYLYYYGQTVDLKGLKVEVKEVPKGLDKGDLLTRATVSFYYWGYGGEPQNSTDDYSATSLFSLGVSFHSEAKPDTVWAEFNNSNLGNKDGDSWNLFTATSDSPLYPARIMITPTVANPDPSEPYYVALRGIQVVYFFSYDEIVAENQTDLTGSVKEVNVTVKTERNVTLQCTPESCSDFIIANSVNYTWSYNFFPTKPTSFKNFLTPNRDSNDGSSSEPIGPYSFTVNKAEATDVCVSINYWLTEDTNLTVTLGSSTASLVLSPTYSIPKSTSIEVADSKYDWYKIKICLSHFMFNLPAGNYTISLIPSSVSSPNFIAVGEIVDDPNNVQTSPLPKQMAKMILQSWSKSSVHPEDDWHYLPEIVAVQPNSLVFEAYPGIKGTVYLMSNWFNLTSDLELHQEMSITACPPRISIQLQLIDSANNLVATQQSDLCSSTNALKSQKVYSLIQGVQNEAHRVQFVLDWTSTQRASLTLSSVDLSDGCRLDRAECSDHGTCTVEEPNKADCECDPGYTNLKCQDPNWCELQFNLTDQSITINGSDFCTARQGICKQESFEPQTRPICECDSTKYWKYDEKLGHSCADLDPCAGVNVFCEMGYICVSNNGTASCSDCDTDYHKDETGKCIKSSPCDKATCIKGAVCKAYEDTPLCICLNGVKYNAVNGCDITDGSCTLDQRRSLGCDHTCSLVSGEPKCNCLPGWNQTELDSKKCEATFNCTVNCPTSPGSVCIANGQQSCTCLPNYVKLPDITVNGTLTPNYECVDICKGSQLNITEAMNQVRSICGTSMCSMDKQGSLICTCDPPYVTGSDGRCHIDTACLPGGKGYSSCASLGAICQPKLEAIESGKPLWDCECPIGTLKSDNGSCVDQCSLGGKDCLFDNAVCQPSTIPKATSHECVCQPGLKKNETDKRCYLIENSMRVEMIIRLNEKMITSTEQQVKKQFTSFYMQAPQLTNTCPIYSSLDLSGCIDYHIQSANEKYLMQRSALMDKAIRSDLISILRSDLINVYGNTFGDINVIHYDKLTDDGTSSLAGDYKVILSLEMTDPNMKIDEVLEFQDPAVCHNLTTSIASSSSYCFIPLQSVLKRGSIFRGELFPCNESYIDYCPSNTRCNPLDSSRFSCDCNPGFKAETIIQMDVNDRDSYYKEYCEDIDECSTLTNPCRDHSTCVNIIGGRLCPCNHEYIEHANGTCINVCSTVKCAYGECYVVSNNTGLCRCHEGYRGETCEEQDPMVTTFRTALITVAVILSLLLVGVVLVAVILIKKTKRSAMKQNTERPMAEYGRAQVPKRYQDNSGFTND